MNILTTTCCIAGGGPAGMMAGYLLARAGVDVIVLEKHTDFLRDFRGDTVHPSTLNVMHELGILEDFLKRPHQAVSELAARIGGQQFRIGDFTRLPGHAKQMVMMPQWDFLDFLKEKASAFPQFRLQMQAKVTGLLEQNGYVTGVTAETPDGPLQIRARLVIGADGRHSTVRQAAGLAIKDLGAPIDVLWMRVSRRADDPPDTLGVFDRGRMMVMINRDDYWQCAYVIKKGGSDVLEQRGLDALKADLAKLSGYPSSRFDELCRWDDIKLLTVAVDHLRTWWKPGLLCIGDSAHAMSPVGGVGINLAIQDAVAAANILAAPLTSGQVTDNDLAAVQKRRAWPAYGIQYMQSFVHKNIINRVLAENGNPMNPPWIVRMMDRHKNLRGIPARLVGLGLRPEHAINP